MKSTYSITKDIDEFADEFTRIESQGFDLVDVKYANGFWFAAYGDNIGRPKLFVNETAWNGEPTLKDFQARVAERKADGYDLTDVEYTDDGYWLGIFSDNVLDSELIIAEDDSEFEEQLLELQDLDPDSNFNYQVVDIEDAEGLQVGVVNRIFGDANYTFSEDIDEFTQEVEQQQDLGIELTNVEYSDSGLFGIFTENLSGLSAYSPQPHAGLDDFTAEIEDFGDKGFDLINVESIDGDWFGIYKENTDGTDDIITPSDLEDIANPSQSIVNQSIIPDIISSTFDF